MLKIRVEQMDALASGDRRRFLDALCEHLGGLFPEECQALPSDALQSRIEALVDEAAGYGIDIEDDVRRFAEHKLRTGWRFPAGDEILSILELEDEDGTTKMHMIDDLLGGTG